MKKPQQYTFALVTSVIIAVLVYMSLGVIGAITFNQAPGGIEDFVINNIPHGNIVYYICCVGICFVAYFSYPVAVFPGILALESGIKECRYIIIIIMMMMMIMIMMMNDHFVTFWLVHF